MPYPWLGLTRGLNSPTATLDPQIVTWAQQLGVQYFRMQARPQNIWLNFADDPSIWSWTNWDNAVQQIIQAGMIPIVTIDTPMPTWMVDGGLNSAWLASSEPFSLPSAFGLGGANSTAWYAYNVAKHFNGVTVTTTGTPLRVNYIGWNEELNIHNVPGTLIGTVTLNQDLGAGQSYTQIQITPSAISAPAFSSVEIPVALTNGILGPIGSSLYCQLFSGLSVNATVLQVGAIIDGSLNTGQPFIPTINVNAGATIGIDQRGFVSNPFSLYNGLLGTTNPTKPQPARNYHYAAIMQQFIYNAIKTGGKQLVGAPVMWWKQPQSSQYPGSVGNYRAYTHGLFSEMNVFGRNQSFADWLDLHVYTGTQNPMIENNTPNQGCYSFPHALSDVREGSLVGGRVTRTLPIFVSEVGWDSINDVTEPVQATNFTNTLQAFQSFTVADGAPNAYFVFTIDHSGASQSGFSLMGFNGVSYYQKAAWTVVSNFRATNASILT